MASRKSSASKTAQQRVITSSRGDPHGKSATKQKRSVEPETLVGLNSKAEGTPSSASMMVMEAGDGGAESRGSSRASLGSRSLSNLGQVPPRSDSSISQRVMTPTKHVFLTAVRRKQESEIAIEPELDWREFTRSNSSLRFGVRSNSQNSFSQPSNADEEQGIESSASLTTQSESGYSSKADTVVNPSDAQVNVATKMQAMTVNSNGKVDKSADGDKSSDDDDDEEEEPRKAPNELFMEFLECLMKKEFATAEKLCRMILIYEPDNAEAQKFHPIILEKLEIDKEAKENGDNDEDVDEDGDDGDADSDEDEDSDDDDDSDDDSNDDTSLDDDSDDEDAIAEENEDAGPPRPDSGIGM